MKTGGAGGIRYEELVAGSFKHGAVPCGVGSPRPRAFVVSSTPKLTQLYFQVAYPQKYGCSSEGVYDSNAMEVGEK